MKKSSKRHEGASFSGSENRSGYDHDEIARKAHGLWEQSGRPDGRDEEFWLSAERELRGDASGSDDESQRGAVQQMEMSARPAGDPAVDDQNESRTADAASTRGSRGHR